jgi:predicted phosphoribosyltransferase
MQALVYEKKVDSGIALGRRIFAAAEHIRNHPHNIASATQSLLMRAKKCIATRGGHFEQLS